MTKQKVTIIIPVRITSQVYQAEERLKRLAATIPRNKFEIIVSDYGTPPEHRATLDALAQDGIRVVSRPGVENQLFSPGHCRDYGVQQARTEVVMLNDLDFYANEAMYSNIHAEIMARNLAVNTYDFFCVPAFFLSEKGSRHYLSQLEPGPGFNYKIHRLLYENKEGFCLFPAYGSSAIAVNRAHYLALGGHNHEFCGHGAEDYDLLHRLSHYYPRGPRTADYYRDTKSNAVNRYLGFRAFFALYGIDVLNRGLFLVHLWHPSRTMINNYYQSRRNFALLEKTMRAFDRERLQPRPLEDLAKNGRQLVLLKDANSILAKALRQALPLLGAYEIRNESDFADGPDLLGYLERRRIDQVGLLNPYGNEGRLRLYQSLREAGRDFWVFDRGALPDSWFFDRGFNYDSPSYHPQAWDRPLSGEKQARAEEYISWLRRGEAVLEKNGPRVNLEELKAQYKIGSRKVLFIPCQRPGDSVIAHFSGPVGGMAGFYGWAGYLARHLNPQEWLIIYKKHPLESQAPSIPNAVMAKPDTHIHDLLELATAVFLVNSGVGLLGLAFGKPVICAGLAFYAHEGLARAVSSLQEALAAIASPLPPDPEKVRRFYWHLLERVYSFGSSAYEKSVAPSGSSHQVVKEITFQYINFAGRRYHYGRPKPGVPLDAPLFACFGDTIKPLKGPAGPEEPVRCFSTKTNPFPARGVKAKKNVFYRKLRKLVKKPRCFVQDFLVNRRGC